MENHLLDAILAPALIPTIMSINVYKQFSLAKTDQLYSTVTFGIVLSASHDIIQWRLKRFTKSRSMLTLLTAAILTTTTIIAILGFNLLRMNIFKDYDLPLTVRGQTISNGSDVFRYHFFADFIPGLIIFTQTQLCSIIKHDLVNKAKRLFTTGEAAIIAQLVSASYLTWALITFTKMSGAGPFAVDLTTDIVLNVGLVIVGLVFLPFYLIIHGPSTLIRYSLIGLSLALSYTVVGTLISYTSKLEPLTWLVDYIFKTHQRISLFSLWLSALTACVSFSTSWSRMVGQTNSLVRKVFHLAIACVFITGYNQDIGFTLFAAGGILIVLFLLELVRACQLKPIGKHLESVCQSLRGKWDNRYITLSHMYLLIGIFLPFWILPYDTSITDKLKLSSGLISVGVGDTAAAIIGTFFGKTTLRGKSGKTLEGLLGNLIAMIIFKLLWVGVNDFPTEFSFIVAATFTSIIEAITDACDNLILPLVMILFLEIV